MAGRRASSRTATVFAQTPKVADAKTQRALEVHSQAILDLQARRHLEQFSATEPGYVPESGGDATMFLSADGTWKVVSGSGLVDSVTAGSSMVSVSPTTGNVVVDVVPSNFTGIPMGGITFSGTNNRISKFSGATLADSTITDTGALVTIASPLNVTGAADFDSSLLVNSTLTVNGAVDFDSTLDVDGAVNFDSTLTLSAFTAGSVLFAGSGGLVSQDNTKFFYDAPNDRLGIGTNAPSVALHTVGTGAFTGASAGLFVGATGITRTGGTGFTETIVEFTRDTANTVFVSAYGSLATDVPSVQVFRARGTAAASSAIQSGDVIGTVAFTGATSATAHHSGSYLAATATENWATGTNIGTKLELYTTKNAGGGRAVRLLIDHDGATTITGASASTALLVSNTGTGMATGSAMISSTNSNTVDTSGGAQTSYVLYADAAGSRSAGASSLTNIGGRFRARNGQTNVALRTDEGTVTLNVVNGTTSIGPSFTIDPNAQLHVRVAASGATAAAAGSGIVTEQNGVSYVTIKGPAATEKGVLFSNTTAANDGGVLYDNSGFARGLQLRAAGTNFVTISSAGAVTIGSATTQGHTVNGSMALTSTAASTPAFISTYSGTTQTADRHAAQAINSGTYNTTAGSLAAYGLLAQSTASRSSGANNLTNIGAYCQASGAQVNYAIWANAGDVMLNANSGVTSIRVVPTSTIALSISANTLQYGVQTSQSSTGRIVETRGINVSTTGSSDATLATRENYGAVISVSSTRSAGANIVINSGIYIDVTGGQTNYGIRQPNGDNLFNQTSGTSTFGGATAVQATSTATHLPLTATFASTAQTGDRTTLLAQNTGTYDATAAARAAYALRATSSATRSAGANNLTSYAVHATASGAQVNYALFTSLGDVRLNDAGGTTTIVGALTCSSTVAINGNCTIGDAAGDAHTINGTADFNHAMNVDGAVTMTSTLAVTGTTSLNGNANICDAAGDTLKFHGGTGATQQTVTGSRGGNAALADLLTKLATLGLIVDGTSA